MSIGENIYEYRKAKNMTQAELGDVLGVSNQTVSKWETGLSMPDVMLLPDIARALGVTLDALYGIESPKPADRCTCADEFPAAAYEEMLRYFVRSTKPYFTNMGTSVEDRTSGYRARIENGEYVACYSNTEGAFFMTDSFAYIDRTFKEPESESIFSIGHIAMTLKTLSDRKLLRVLEYEYKTSCKQDKSYSTSLFSDDIADACGLSIEETEECLGKLVMMNLNEMYSPKGQKCEYYLQYQNMMFALAILKLADVMANDKAWLLVRDTQIILDYVFES